MKNLMNLKNAKILSKVEQRSINGGIGGCAIMINGQVWGNVSLSSINKAIGNMKSGDSLHWCCDSCATASWLHK